MPGSQRSVQSVLRNLQRRNARRREGAVVLEGVRLVNEALAAGVTIIGVAASPSLERTERGRALLARLEEAEVRLERLTDGDLARLADTDTPQGVLAVAEPAPWSLDAIDISPSACILVLDQVQDPGNVGTIIRTAHALGAAAVVLLPGTALVTHPKVLRAAMGSTFHLPVVRAEGQEVRTWLADHGVEVWVADASGERPRREPHRGPVALVVGNEGAGVSREWRAAAARVVAIPMAPGVESLNAATAAAILLYEVARDS